MTRIDPKNAAWSLPFVPWLLLLGACVPPQTAAAPSAIGDNDAANYEASPIRIASDAERVRMERYVTQLQAAKKVAKSFVTPGRETVECVDIYSQPSLQRREMQNHRIELAPRTVPPELAGAAEPPRGSENATQLYSITGETCPEGSAPMARLTMETLQRFRTLDEFLRKGGDPDVGEGTIPPAEATHEYATARRTVDNWGAESVFNLWSPYVETADEFSLSQLWVVRGSGVNRETVEAGWQVYRNLYGDWRAHLFIYFTPDNYGSGGCYNLSCSGFVQVSNTVYIGGGFTNYSTASGPQYTMKLLMYKDGPAGHWWLKYGDTWVGYYPRSLFDSNGLESRAERFSFGGEIVNKHPGDRHTATDMGSGHWPYEGFGHTAYQRGMRYVDTQNIYRFATGMSVSKTNRECYDMDVTDSSGTWETYAFLGGSGRNTKCP